LHMDGIGIDLGINRDGSNVEFLARSNNPNGNFPAISHQDFFKHGSEVKELE